MGKACASRYAENVGTTFATPPRKRTFRRRLGFVVVAVGAAISWALIAEYLLQIERRYLAWLPVYFVLIVFYWLLVFGAIADHLQDIPARGERWLKGVGAVFVALLVFLLLSVLLAIPLMG